MKNRWTGWMSVAVAASWLVAGVLPLQGADYTWDAGGSGNWTTALNWDLDSGDPDDTGDTATIDEAGTYTVSLGSSKTVGGLTLNAADAILDVTAGSLRVDDGSFTRSAGTLSGTYRLHGTVSYVVGDIDAGQTLTQVTSYNQGVATLNSASGFANNGAWTMNASGVGFWAENIIVNVTSGAITNKNSMSLVTGGSWGADININSDFVNDAGATLSFSDPGNGGGLDFTKEGATLENRGDWTAGFTGNNDLTIAGNGTSFTQSGAGASLDINGGEFQLGAYTDTSLNTFTISGGTIDGEEIFYLNRTSATVDPSVTVVPGTLFDFRGDTLGGESGRPVNVWNGDVPANLTIRAKTWGTSEGTFLSTPGSFVNDGTVTITSANGAGFNGAEGRLTIGAGGSGTVTNNGTLTVSITSVPSSYGTLTAQLNGNVVNYGTFDLGVTDNVANNGHTRFYGDLLNEAGGTVSVTVTGSAAGNSLVDFMDGAAGSYVNRGAFDLNVGTLDLSGGTLVTESGGVFQGRGTIQGDVVVESGGTLSGFTDSVGLLTVSGGDLTLDDGVTYQWAFNALTNDITAVDGTLDFGGGAGTVTLDIYNLGRDIEPTESFVLFTFTGAAPTLPSFTYNTANSPLPVQVTGGSGAVFIDGQIVYITGLEAVNLPEPSTAFLLLLGLIGIRRARRHRSPGRALLAILLAAGLGLAIHPAARAADYTWDAGGSGNWTTALNWNLDSGHPDDAGDSATIDETGAGAYTVLLDAGKTISEFALGSADAAFSTGANTLVVDGNAGTTATPGLFSHTAGGLDGNFQFYVADVNLNNAVSGSATVFDFRSFSGSCCGIQNSTFDVGSNEEITANQTLQLFGVDSRGLIYVDTTTDITNLGTVRLHTQGISSGGNQNHVRWTLNGGAGTLLNQGLLLLEATRSSGTADAALDGHLINDTAGTVSGTANSTSLSTTRPLQLVKSGGQHENRGTWSITGTGMQITGNGTTFTQEVAGASLAVSTLWFGDDADGTQNLMTITDGSMEGDVRLGQTALTLGSGVTITDATTFKFEGESFNSFIGDVPANVTIDLDNPGVSEGALLTTPGSFINNGTITMRSDGAGFNAGEGRLTVNGGAGTLTNNGSLSAETVVASWEVDTEIFGDLVNNGTIDLTVTDNNSQSGQVILYGDLLNEAGGTVSVGVTGSSSANSDIRFADGASGSFVNRGAFNLTVGTLDLNGGTLVTESGGIFRGRDTIAGDVEVEGGGTLSGYTNSVGLLTVSGGDLTLDDGATYQWAFNALTNDITAVDGTLAFGGGASTITLDIYNLGRDIEATESFVLFTFTGAAPTLPSFAFNTANSPLPVQVTGGSGSVFIDGQFVYITSLEAVNLPEPSTALLLILGLTAIRHVRRRRRPTGPSRG